MAGRTHFLEVTRLTEYLRDEENRRARDSDSYQIVLIKQGRVTVSIGQTTYAVCPNEIYFLAPGQLSYVLGADQRTDGYCITFDTDYFLLCLKNQVQLCFYPFFQINRYPILPLGRGQRNTLEALVRKINTEYQHRTSINDDLLTKLYLNVLLIEIERLYYAQADQHGEPPRKKLIAAKFKQLVDERFLRVRRVADYAEVLYLSPNYLTQAVRASTGQSASQIIYDRVILEAKTRLIQTERSVSEIAYALNYQDASYFCRFFRKHTGTSPQQFRQTNHFPIRS